MDIFFFKEINNTVIMTVLWNWAIITNVEITMTMSNAMIASPSGESTGEVHNIRREVSRHLANDGMNNLNFSLLFRHFRIITS